MEGIGIRKVQNRRVCFTEQLKRSICEEYLDGVSSKEELRKKYGIRGKSGILKWLRHYGYVESINRSVFMSARDDSSEDKQGLLARIKELEKKLEHSQLESDGWRKMIEIAEREYKIEIRKKSDTKQSRR